MFKKIYKAFKNPSKICIILLNRKFTRLLPDKVKISLLYRLRIGRKINLNSPKTFNEKLQWLKLYDRNSIYVNLVDKYEVRKFVTRKIGKEYLIPLYGVYDKYEDINFSMLPEKFVLKPTHTSGDVIICRNKKILNIKDTKKTITKWLKRNYYWDQREWLYKHIKPRIICEELLEDESQDEIIDYKILCFNGEPKCLFICLDRGSTNGLKVDFYDLNWNPLPFERHYPKSGRIVKKPERFEEMLELSRILAKDILFVRVDLYITNQQIKFGELTFYPGSGFEEFSPEEYDTILGNLLVLPK